ncbi:MAG: peptidase M23 [Proteobacteria bacterium]|nr:MAG: peptidase M23 [Pseudomonadota bacterium]
MKPGPYTFGLLASATLLALGTLLSLPLAAKEEPTHQKRLEAVRGQIRDLQEALKRSQTERGELQGILQNIETQLGGVARSLRTIDNDLEKGSRELKALHERRGKLHGSLAEQRDLLARQVRAAYAMGRQEQLKMLLNQQDPARVGRALVYYDYFNRARAQQISQVRTTLQELDQVELQITEKNVELAALRDRQLGEQRTLEAGRSARRELLARINQGIKSTGRQLTNLQEDEQRLVRLLQDLARRPAAENAERTAFAKLRGKLRWPTRGKIAVRYGEPRSIGKLRWQGMLIDAPEGREVRAVSHGRVAFADWLRGFGLLLIIDHGDGFMSLYGHNQSLFKETGDWVEPGDVVASVGASGGQSEAGLYFEIRQGGRPVNPQRWCESTKGLNVGMNWPA